MEYKVILDSFEGPLDLLLHLIDKSEVDIYDISIAEITDQYIEYLKKMEELDLEITSEFLVMAATLLEIKSKMLLPIEKKEKLFDEDEIDPRQELIEKLIEYRRFKAAAIELKDREVIQSMIYSKPREDIAELIDDAVQLSIDGIELNTLVNALHKLMKKNRQTISEPTFTNINRDSITIEESMDNILATLYIVKNISFEDIFKETTNRFEIVVTFLALLELIKLEKISVKQENSFKQINIKLRNN
ncbi:segregation/condensation protein A [Clostridiaceae bacterium M8S5]|nr:segregation/condensation protein A [Clostridiaceae bacterium M8S5]